MTEQIKAINITKSNISNICDLKCAYSFDYPETNITAKNNEINISLTCDNINKAPVLFNNMKYTINKINLYAPSIHLYDGLTTPGEFFIEHVPELGGPNLIVCIPMVASGEYTAATDLITQVIDNVSTNAPSKGETSNLNISSFSLNHIIPKKPFIYYEGNYNNTITEFIVFPSTSPIPLAQATLTKLGSIIQPFHLLLKGGDLFLNTKGPNTGKRHKNDDIYISCKPTGASEEVSYITQPNPNNTSSSTNLFSNPTFMNFLKIFLIFFVFIVFLLSINYAFNTLTRIDIKIPGLRN